MPSGRFSSGRAATPSSRNGISATPCCARELREQRLELARVLRAVVRRQLHAGQHDAHAGAAARARSPPSRFVRVAARSTPRRPSLAPSASSRTSGSARSCQRRREAAEAEVEPLMPALITRAPGCPPARRRCSSRLGKACSGATPVALGQRVAEAHDHAAPSARPAAASSETEQRAARAPTLASASAASCLHPSMAARADHTTLRPRMEAARPDARATRSPRPTPSSAATSARARPRSPRCSRAIGCALARRAGRPDRPARDPPRAAAARSPGSASARSASARCSSACAAHRRAATACCARCIGMGYSDTIVPPVIQRNILENPGWYTQYTPYQAEISQGRLEALLNFQTMVADLTGLPLANASLLDEATAAAEAMAMCRAVARGAAPRLLRRRTTATRRRSAWCGRARSRWGSTLRVGDRRRRSIPARRTLCGVLLQYPTTDGRIVDSARVDRARARGGRAGRGRGRPARAHAARAAGRARRRHRGRLDAALRRADRLRRSARRATSRRATSYARRLPGRLVGVSRDAHGRPAYRLAIQTREQHIRRDKATSNICTAQVLLAIMAGMYAVYHGPDGLRRIARRVRGLTACSPRACAAWATSSPTAPFFDTLRVDADAARRAKQVLAAARRARHQPARLRRRRASASRSTRRPRARTSSELLEAFAARRDAAGRSTRSPRAADAPLPARARAHERVPRRTRSSTRTTASTRCCATCTGSRRATSRSPPR